MNDPGKYDDVCMHARYATGAAGCLLIVLDGSHGHGFSVQVPPEVIGRIPALLRELADMIEAQASPSQ